MSPKNSSGGAKAVSINQVFALRAAWFAWVFLLLCPFAMIAVMIAVPSTHVYRGAYQGVSPWFLVTMLFLAVGFPAALFIRHHLCRAYALGSVVTPRHYFAGMLTVWLTLEIGMIVSLVGCCVTAALLPGLIPWIVAFVFLMTLWPNGKMMTSRAGNAGDPERYQKPG